MAQCRRAGEISRKALERSVFIKAYRWRLINHVLNEPTSMTRRPAPEDVYWASKIVNRGVKSSPRRRRLCLKRYSAGIFFRIIGGAIKRWRRRPDQPAEASGLLRAESWLYCLNKHALIYLFHMIGVSGIWRLEILSLRRYLAD